MGKSFGNGGWARDGQVTRFQADSQELSNEDGKGQVTWPSQREECGFSLDFYLENRG